MILNLSAIKKENRKVVGNKAYSLSELIKIGQNVPKGFIVFPEVSLIKDKNRILEMFDSLRLVKVSVRSSTTVEDSINTSFAGQFDTFLNVSKKALLQTIKRCRNSVSNLGVKSYCKIHNIDPGIIKVAVIVQKMINSDISGVGFSINPVTLNRNEIIIETVSGTGEKLVSGKVTPNSYWVDKSKNNITKHIIHSKQKMPTAKAIKVARAICDIETHFNCPVDVEWAFSGDKLYILQSRPITGVKSLESS